MTKRVQLIGHITAVANAFIGRSREVTVDTTKDTLRVHNGSLPGGRELARADLSNVADATVNNSGKMSTDHVQKISTLLVPMALIHGSDTPSSVHNLISGSPNIPMGANPIYNVDDIFDTVSKRVVVPAGVTYLRLTAQIHIRVQSASTQEYFLRKNGAGSIDLNTRNGYFFLPSDIAQANDLFTAQIQSPVMRVSQNDYFQIGHNEFSAATVNLYRSWLQVEGG